MNTVDYDTDRYAMWCKHIPYYPSLTKQQKKRAKLRFAIACGYDYPSLVGWFAQIEKRNKMECTTISMNGVDNCKRVMKGKCPEISVLDEAMVKFDVPCYERSLGTFEFTSLMNAVPTWTHTATTERCLKREETMYNETQEVQQRSYLERRANSVYDKHSETLRKHFHIAQANPVSLKEALDKLTSGKFTINQKYVEHVYEDYASEEDAPFYDYYLNGAINWDPTTPDKEGFKASFAVLEKANQDTKDTIKVSSLDKGLEALKAFEKASFH